MSKTFKYHLVSRVLLRQFCDSSGRLFKCNLLTKKCKPVYPEMVCYEQADTSVFKSLDEKWQTTELDIPKAIEAVRDKSLVNSKESQLLLKRLIAIHYVRSRAAVSLFSEKFNQGINEFIAEHPDENEASLRARWASKTPKVFRNFCEKTYREVASWMRDKHLEIITLSEPSFFLGDNPVINMNRNGVGVYSGVGLKNCECLYMPVSPTQCVSITSRQNAVYQSVNSRQLSFLNTMTIKNSLHQFFKYPEDIF